MSNEERNYYYHGTTVLFVHKNDLYGADPKKFSSQRGTLIQSLQFAAEWTFLRAEKNEVSKKQNSKKKLSI